MKADPSSDFQWNLMCRPDYQAYVSTPGINGFDHLARVNLDYHLSGTTDVFLNEQFQHVLNLVDRSQTLQADQAGLGQPLARAGHGLAGLESLLGALDGTRRIVRDHDLAQGAHAHVAHLVGPGGGAPALLAGVLRGP